MLQDCNSVPNSEPSPTHQSIPKEPWSSNNGQEKKQSGGKKKASRITKIGKSGQKKKQKDNAQKKKKNWGKKKEPEKKKKASPPTLFYKLASFCKYSLKPATKGSEIDLSQVNKDGGEPLIRSKLQENPSNEIEMYAYKRGEKNVLAKEFAIFLLQRFLNS